MFAASYISDARSTGVSFVVVCDRSVRLAGLWLVQLAFWKGLPNALHTCCYPADGVYNEREGAVFTGCQVLCWVLSLGATGGSKPKRGANKYIFKMSCMQKESFSIRGQLLNMHFIMERVELQLGLLGGSGISHFRPAGAVGFVAVTLFGLRFQGCFLRTACCKHLTVSVHKEDKPRAERRKGHFLGLS